MAVGNSKAPASLFIRSGPKGDASDSRRQARGGALSGRPGRAQFDHKQRQGTVLCQRQEEVLQMWLSKLTRGALHVTAGCDELEWAEGYRPLGRQAFEEIIEQQMATAVEVYLEQLEGDDVAHRRNRYYRRHLLTELGDIELNVPRTRRYSPGRGAAHVRPAHGRDRPGDPRRLCARLVHPQGGRGAACPARAAGERRNGEPSQTLFARCTRCDAVRMPSNIFVPSFHRRDTDC